MASGQHKPKDKNWKEFEKMAMFFFQKLPVVPLGFRGFLHDCESVNSTMSDLRAVPKIDKDRWIQYCFQNFLDTMGEEKIYVEFNIDWNEWADDKLKKKILHAEESLENPLDGPKKELKVSF